MSVDDALARRTALWHGAVTASDEHLRGDIEDELAKDPHVNEADITVAVAGDVITLTGLVRTAAERACVLAAVHRIGGMHPVHDRIAIRHTNEGNALRGLVREAIRRSFHRTADIDAANVGVVCEGGAVWLTGRVQSFAARTQAENASWAIPGVKQVNNDIRVGSTFDPRLSGEVDEHD